MSAGATEIGNAIRALINADGGFEELTPADSKLSKRQKQLIVMLDRGLSNREIADELGISEHTVKVHLWRLFRRLGVKSRTQTIHYARIHGMLTS
jgi:DNA-binding NarL/FixJ family response regulator